MKRFLFCFLFKKKIAIIIKTENSIKDFEGIIRNYKRAFQKCEVEMGLKNENLLKVLLLLKLIWKQLFFKGNPEI